MTASTFQSALLRTLAAASSHKAGAPVRASTLYEDILRSQGIQSPEALGALPNGQPKAIALIQQAQMALRKQGFTTMISKGVWAITPEGLAQVPSPLTVSNPPQMQQEVVMSNTVVLDPALTALQSDEHFIELASKQSDCFGYFSSHAAAPCGGCWIKHSCQSAQFGLLAAVAFNIQNPKVEEEAAPEAPRTQYAWDKAKLITVQTEMVCFHCTSTIPAQSEAYWICNAGDVTSQQIFCPVCRDREMR